MQNHSPDNVINIMLDSFQISTDTDLYLREFLRKRSLIFFLLYVLLILGWIIQSREFIAFMIPFFVYLCAGIIYKTEKVQLKVSRTLSVYRAMTDTPITIRLEVFNEGPGIEEVLLQDLLPSPLKPVSGSSSIITSLESGETLNLEYKLQPGRGHYEFQGVSVSANDYFNLFRINMKIRLEDQLTVLPDFNKLKQFEIRPRKTRPYPGFIPSRNGGQGVDFFDVREYQHGDPMRLINWKISARHRRMLFTNEFEQERIADVGIILDIRKQSYGTIENRLFEYALTITTSLMDTLLNAGNRVGLFIFGQHINWIMPGYGKIQKERILQAITRTRVKDYLGFDRWLERFPERIFPYRSLLILISPLLMEDKPGLMKLIAHGYQVLVLSPDIVSFEKETLKPVPDFELGARIVSLERMLILRDLQRNGVNIINLPLDMPLQNIPWARLNRHSSHYRQ